MSITARQQSVITIEAALNAVQTALTEGQRLEVPVSATVVDASMTLVAFGKADGATPHSVDTSCAKPTPPPLPDEPPDGWARNLRSPSPWPPAAA